MMGIEFQPLLSPVSSVRTIRETRAPGTDAYHASGAMEINCVPRLPSQTTAEAGCLLVSMYPENMDFKGWVISSQNGK
jgi:hypothetical protein